MNKFLALAAASVFAMAISATAASAQSYFDGAYVGGALGYGIGDVSPSNNATGVTIRGFDGQVFGGYGTSFDSVYVGVEATGSYSDHSARNAAGNAFFTQNYDYGVSGRLGFLPTDDSMLYTSLGLGRIGIEDKTGAATTHEDLMAYKVGFGAQQVISDNVFARVGVDFNIPTETTSFGAHMTTQSARFGLGFTF